MIEAGTVYALNSDFNLVKLNITFDESHNPVISLSESIPLGFNFRLSAQISITSTHVAVDG